MSYEAYPFESLTNEFVHIYLFNFIKKCQLSYVALGKIKSNAKDIKFSKSFYFHNTKCDRLWLP